MTPPRDLFSRSVQTLAADLRDGSYSARELLDHYLERIERLNPQINAFVFLDPKAADAADRSDALLRAGRPRSPLEGIPIAIKDNLLVRDWPAVWGSAVYAHYVPAHDELPVARLRESGAVLLGKTNVPEFSLGGYTANPIFGVTRNPWDPALTPGGSSGGAVAAVAARLVPLALATDGGGSIRRPAAHTGLVGLKPTVGRVRRGNGFPVLMFDCEVVGPVAHSVGGARLLFERVAENPAARSPRAKRARVLFAERFGDAPVDPEITERVREGAANLATLGHQITQGPLPFSVDKAVAACQELATVGLATLSQHEPRFMEKASADFVSMAKAGLASSPSDRDQWIDTVLKFRKETARAFETIDIIMTPATAAQPWPADEPYPRTIAGEAVGPRGHAVFTGWVNACGHPAIAIPCRHDEAGLPIGFQLVGAPGADEWLLDIAEEYEAAFPWAARWPALALRG